MEIPRGLTHVEYLRIQLEAVLPYLRLFEEEYGKEAVQVLLEKKLGERMGKALATEAVEADFDREVQKLESYRSEDALEYEITKHDSEGLEFNVTRCAYVDLLEELGARDLGYLLVCGHDFPEAIEDGMVLSRSKTCMQGDGICDFRYRRRERR